MLFETAAAVGAGLLSGFLSTVYFRWLDKRGKMEIFFRPMWDDVGFTFNDYRGKQYASLPLRLEFFNRSRSSKIVGDFWVFFFNRATGHEFPTMQVRNRGSEEGISSQLDTSRYAEYTYSFSLPATTMREVVLQFDVPSFEKLRDGDIFDIYFGYTNEKGRQERGLLASMNYESHKASFAFRQQYHQLQLLSAVPLIGHFRNKRAIQRFQTQSEEEWLPAEAKHTGLITV